MMNFERGNSSFLNLRLELPSGRSKVRRVAVLSNRSHDRPGVHGETKEGISSKHRLLQGCGVGMWLFGEKDSMLLIGKSPSRVAVCASKALRVRHSLYFEVSRIWISVVLPLLGSGGIRPSKFNSRVSSSILWDRRDDHVEAGPVDTLVMPGKTYRLAVTRPRVHAFRTR